jgi:hypothetical protein
MVHTVVACSFSMADQGPIFDRWSLASTLTPGRLQCGSSGGADAVPLVGDQVTALLTLSLLLPVPVTRLPAMHHHLVVV